ncbi:MAG: adenosyl-hopene transferase HpnH [Proteobacteria bacterium]|nr:adenosyl-hopene transferase HpnH [Pseudomonadota bacterium]
MRFPLGQTVSIARYIGRMKGRGVKRFPLVLMLEPLHACNLTCSGCGRIREYKAQMSRMLSLEQSLKAVEDCGAPVVSICGGEPLIYPEISALVEKTLERNRVVYLCTNGWALEEKLPLFTPHRRFNINVHIDALAATHDMIVEKRGAFDRAVAGIVAAKKAGFTVCTNTTIYTQTDTGEIKALFEYLEGLGVDGMLVSPGFDYSDVEDRSVFLTREAIKEKFTELRETGRGKRIWQTPLFLDFAAGRRDYPCTPWGNVTYNVCGWKAPCYLITDGHHETFDGFMNDVDWERYGPGRDPRCANCMCHCGFEPTVALTTTSSVRDALTMAKWTLF